MAAAALASSPRQGSHFQVHPPLSPLAQRYYYACAGQLASEEPTKGGTCKPEGDRGAAVAERSSIHAGDTSQEEEDDDEAVAVAAAAMDKILQ